MAIFQLTSFYSLYVQTLKTHATSPSCAAVPSPAANKAVSGGGWRVKKRHSTDPASPGPASQPAAAAAAGSQPSAKAVSVLPSQPAAAASQPSAKASFGPGSQPAAAAKTAPPQPAEADAGSQPAAAAAALPPPPQSAEADAVSQPAAAAATLPPPQPLEADGASQPAPAAETAQPRPAEAEAAVQPASEAAGGAGPSADPGAAVASTPAPPSAQPAGDEPAGNEPADASADVTPVQHLAPPPEVPLLPNVPRPAACSQSLMRLFLDRADWSPKLAALFVINAHLAQSLASGARDGGRRAECLAACFCCFSGNSCI